MIPGMGVVVLGGIGAALYGIAKSPSAPVDTAAADAIKAQIAEHETYAGQLQTLIAGAGPDEDPQVYRDELTNEVSILNQLGAQLKKITGT